MAKNIFVNVHVLFTCESAMNKLRSIQPNAFGKSVNAIPSKLPLPKNLLTFPLDQATTAGHWKLFETNVELFGMNLSYTLEIIRKTITGL